VLSCRTSHGFMWRYISAKCTPPRCVLLAGLVCLGLLGIQLLVEDYSLLLAIGGSVMVFTMGFLACIESSRYRLWFTPVSFFCFWQAASSGLAVIWLSQFSHYRFFSVYLFPEDVWKGFCVVMVGTVAEYAGLQVLRPRIDKTAEESHQNSIQLQASKGQLNPKLRLLALSLFWVFGAIIVTTDLPLGSLRGSFALSSNAALLSFALVPPSRLRLSDSTHTAVLLWASVITVATTIPQQSKLYPMLAGLPMFVHAWQRPALRRTAVVFVAVAAFLYLTIWGPVVNPSRSIKHGTPVEKMWESFLQNSPLATGDFSLRHYREQTDNLISRLAYCRDVSFEVREADSKGHRPELFLVNFKWGFYPRILFPEKPWISRGAWFTSYVGFSRSESEATMATAMYPSGELYWSFGLVGVIIGNFFLGLMASGLWRMASASPVLPFQALLYMNLMVLMSEVAEASSAFITLFFFYGLFGLLFLPRDSTVKAIRFKRWGSGAHQCPMPQAGTHPSPFLFLPRDSTVKAIRFKRWGPGTHQCPMPQAGTHPSPFLFLPRDSTVAIRFKRWGPGTHQCPEPQDGSHPPP
jgi:hypothetical protein